LHWLELKWIKKANSISAPSKFQSNYYKELIGKHVETIPNPLSDVFFEQMDSYTTETNPIPTILYTGRIEYRKGSLVLIEAFGMLLKTLPEAQLYIAGARHNSISEDQWQQALYDAGVSDNIHQLGHIPFEELGKYYRKASVFVMPSYYETFGISVIEAMAHGLPVVASSAGALPELVKDSVNGLVVEPGNARTLSDALLNILTNPKKAIELGKAGKEIVRLSYTSSSVVTGLNQFYSDTF
jgi:glycosyltransferase involved in cell wall biosynthesis